MYYEVVDVFVEYGSLELERDREGVGQGGGRMGGGVDYLLQLGFQSNIFLTKCGQLVIHIATKSFKIGHSSAGSCWIGRGGKWLFHIDG